MVSYLQIFYIFSKIGAFTIGGGYAMLPLIKQEIVSRGWMQDEDFTDIIALAQAAPGLLAVNISIFTGYRLRGVKGSIVATLGSILPSFVIMLAIAAVFTGYRDNPIVIKMFKGIRPVIVALIAVPMIQMAKKGNKEWWSWCIMTAALIPVAFLNISPIYILLVVIVASASVSVWREKRRKRN